MFSKINFVVFDFFFTSFGPKFENSKNSVRSPSNPFWKFDNPEDSLTYIDVCYSTDPDVQFLKMEILMSQYYVTH